MSNQPSRPAIDLARATRRRVLREASGGSSTSVTPDIVRYSASRVAPHGRRLQAFLNQFACVELAEDGRLGPRSSDAFRLVTGHLLIGDPRAPSHDHPDRDPRDLDHIPAV